MTHAQCDLCSSQNNTTYFNVAPKSDTLILCQTCKQQIENPATIDPNHWRILAECMWSENPAVQVVSWRLLEKLKKSHEWAMELAEQLYLDEETLNWARAINDSFEVETADVGIPTKDSNGMLLSDGDAVTLTKDLEVKGANFTAKRGTLVKNISLTNNPEHIEGKVNGTHIVILTCFTKKA